MRAFVLTTVLLAVPASLTASVAAAQEAPPVTVAANGPPVADTLTWEKLPPALRARAEALVGRIQGQSVLHVDQAFTPDPGMHPVDHGDLVLVQSVRPAGVAHITASVRNANKYGPVGATLWPGIGPEGDYWCWRRPDANSGRASGNFYCYLDADHDGVTDRMMENDGWMYGLPASQFQFTGLGHDEGVDEAARYAVEDGALGEIREIVAVRYQGIKRGVVDDAGHFGPGRIDFELVAGPDRDRLNLVRTMAVIVDAHGRGESNSLNGIHIEVDGVSMDGVANVRVTSGLPAGRALLSPPLTREDVLEMASEFLNPDGTPKARPEPEADSPE